MGRAHDSLERAEARFCVRCQRHFQEAFSLWLLIRTLYDPDKQPGTLAHILWIEQHEESLDALIFLTNRRKRWPNEEVRAVHRFIRAQDHSLFVQANEVADSQAARLARSMVRA